jgi:transcription antitermination factor NusG
MSGIELYESRMDEGGWRVFQRALRDARRRGQNSVRSEHLIKSLADEERDLVAMALENARVEPGAFGAIVERRIENAPRHADEGTRLDAEAVETLKRGLARARAHGRDKTSAVDILVALSQNEQGALVEIFGELGVEPSAAINGVRAAAEHDGQGHEGPPPSGETAPVYRKGDTVRIKRGAFTAMAVKVTEVDYERSKVTAAVRLFGRLESVELAFSDVEKVSFE